MSTYQFFVKFAILSAVTLFSVGGISTGFAQTDAVGGIATDSGVVGGGMTTADNTLTAEVLCNSLYARTDEEREYCEFVIRMRDENVLPNRILYYAYKKAMQQDNSRRFIYFQTVLELVCERQGIVLEESSTSKIKKFFSLPTIVTKPTQSKVSAGLSRSTDHLRPALSAKMLMCSLCRSSSSSRWVRKPFFALFSKNWFFWLNLMTFPVFRIDIPYRRCQYVDFRERCVHARSALYFLTPRRRSVTKAGQLQEQTKEETRWPKPKKHPKRSR